MRVIIVGGGIGGLTLALMLHQLRIACDVYDEVAIRTRELIYANRFGQ